MGQGLEPIKVPYSTIYFLECMRITWNDNIRKDVENSGVTREEALLLMTDRQEWRSWFAQCARHGMD